MPPDPARTRKLLAASDFKTLFVEELGWNHHQASLDLACDGVTIRLSAVAEKCGMAAFLCAPQAGGRIPDYAMRRKIEHQVTKRAHEHLIIFIDGRQTTQIWQWVRRERGKPSACREHTYCVGQPGESLIQKLQGLAVSLEEEESLSLTDVTGRARKAFDVERVTKRFYDRFKAEHASFLKFLEGIPEEEMERWYVSVMLNRLMFIYFIQKKGFLDNDPDYLKNKLAQCRSRLGKDRYYRDFLCPLFFEGFAKEKKDRSEGSKILLGEVPYLNGGIFMPHQVEQLYGKTISVPDRAFETLFEFFEAYQWHLDDRPTSRDNEIRPDVLGYIFEKYINQKQMGAYYTKEDITEYISKNTIIPFLFDKAKEKCRVAFEGERPVWGLLQEDPDRYIYEAVRRGVVTREGDIIPEPILPDFVQKGMHDPKARMLNKDYNLGRAKIPAPDDANLALPTETWREYAQRRERCLLLRRKLAAGEIRDVNDLITCNLDIRQFSQDVIENCEGPELLVAFWKAIENVTILDPTCGSGAFLFAAVNILEPLYEGCLERMHFLLEEWGEGGKKNHPNYYKLFTETLKRVGKHPSPRYFIFKSIILNNLYGVDLMDEAVEICKLRLFLKLVAQIDRVEALEPLPDIDFNIRAGNTLVGFTSLQEVKHAATLEGTGQGRLLFGETEKTLRRIEEDAEVAARAYRMFQEMQTAQHMSPSEFSDAKETLRARLGKLTDELDCFLASEYGIGERNIRDAKKRKEALENWRKSHQPFHWFAEFHGIVKAGGFDVIIGNPPYLEYSKVATYAIQKYATERCANLYVFTAERSLVLCSLKGRVGMIVPISMTCSGTMEPLRDYVEQSSRSVWVSHFSNRPSQLFTGAQNRLTVFVSSGRQSSPTWFSSRYHRWDAKNGEREFIFTTLRYQAITENRLSIRDAMPKVGCPEAANALSKIGSTKNVAFFLTKRARFKIFWVRVPGYFCTFLLEPPMARPERGGAPRIRGEVNEISFEDKFNRNLLHGLLNSTLYYLFFCVYTDTRHINPSDVAGFPFDLSRFSRDERETLSKLSNQLANCLSRNLNRWRKSGLLIDSFDAKPCKPVIDEIDSTLAKHYGFTDEELDFIINYDIKYRMGHEEAEDSAE